jgi:hypothetical protein
MNNILMFSDSCKIENELNYEKNNVKLYFYRTVDYVSLKMQFSGIVFIKDNSVHIMVRFIHSDKITVTGDILKKGIQICENRDVEPLYEYLHGKDILIDIRCYLENIEYDISKEKVYTIDNFTVN